LKYSELNGRSKLKQTVEREKKTEVKDDSKKKIRNPKQEDVEGKQKN
jgi:hypothetical protein